jgi:hypothetical protein
MLPPDGRGPRPDDLHPPRVDACRAVPGEFGPVRGMARALVLLCLLAACSRDRDEVPRPDTTPPAKVADLAARALSDSTILLAWTAPGDDGMDGTAERYDFRYNSEPFPAQGHFPVSYPEVPGTPKPAPGGTPESLLVGGLTYSTTYHFGMRVMDEMENLSPLSNVASATTAETLYVDNFPPAIVADIDVQRLDLAFYRFTFTVPGDDGMIGQATAFDVRWSREPLSGSAWNDATPVDPHATPTIPGRRQTIEVQFPTGLEDGYTVIRAVDKGGNRSPPHEPIVLPGLTPRTWYVNIEGTGDAPTIQAALDVAGPGDEVLVGPGEYRVNLTMPTWSTYIRSTDGRDETVFEPEDESRSILLMQGSELASWRVEGFTFRNGRALAGAAVRCRSPGVPLIRHCRFIDNRGNTGAGISISTYLHPDSYQEITIERNEFIQNEVDGNGGAIYLVVPVNRPIRYSILQNYFLENSAALDGGAVFAGGGSQGVCRIESNQFWSNQAGDHGGGLYLATSGSRASVVTNLFARNRADGLGLGETGSGGGLNFTQSSGRIVGNTFVDNQGWTESGDGGGAIELEYISRVHLTEGLEIRDNIILGSRGGAILVNAIDALVDLGRNLLWDNGPVETVNLSGGVPVGWGSDLIRADPLFCNPAAGDYSVSANSPAIIGKEVMGALKDPGCP